MLCSGIWRTATSSSSTASPACTASQSWRTAFVSVTAGTLPRMSVLVLMDDDVAK